MDNIQQLIIAVISVSGVCLGLRAASEQGMIFEKFRLWAEAKLGTFWSNPLIGCSKCMVSTWGTLTFLYLFLFFGVNIFLYPIVILTSSFFNGLLYSIYKYYDP